MSQQLPADPAILTPINAKSRLLVLDDDPDDLKAIKDELTKYDLERVDTVTRVKEFRELLKHTEYDAVSIDRVVHGADSSVNLLPLLRVCPKNPRS